MVSYGYFFTGGGWNVVSRIAVTLSIVERQELTLDPLTPFTMDRAMANGSFYSDKAPGLSFLAVPPTLAAARLLDPDRSGRAWIEDADKLSLKFLMVNYVATLCTVSLLAALAVVGVYRWSVAHGASDRGALVAAITLGVATPEWGWATMFFGHAAAGTLLLLGFMGLSAGLERGVPSRRLSPWRAGLAGLTLGAAFVVEFPAGPAVAVIGLSCGVAALARPDRRVLLRRWFAPAALGLALALVPLLVYNNAAFGSPVRLGYENLQEFDGMRVGIMGVSRPDPEVVVALLVGWYRGLLPLSPVLALFPIGLVVAWRDRRWRLAATVAVLVIIYYIGMNASYFYWDGGWATGPRHIVPMLPFAALLMAPLWDAAGRVLRPIYLVLLAVSVGMSALCASISMSVPSGAEHPYPVTEFLLPMLLRGDFHRAVTRLFGFEGPLSVLPLLMAWVGIGWLLLRATRPRGLAAEASEALQR